jgi:hypothetical protein
MDEPHNIKAKDFLIEKLGSCQDLLRKSLRQILVADMFTTNMVGSHKRSRLDEVEAIGDFLNRFLHCLVAVRSNRTTDSL